MDDKEAPVLEMKVFQGPEGEVARMEGPMERIGSGISGRLQRIQDRLQEVGAIGPEAFAAQLRAEREARAVARGERVGEALAKGLASVGDYVQRRIDDGTAERLAPTKRIKDRIEQMKGKYSGHVLELRAKENSSDSHGAGL